MSNVMPHPSDHLKSLIETNSAEIVKMHSRIKETLALRGKSEQRRHEWERACEIFHSRYDILSFPGGFSGALDRILAGDPEAMEAAICFLELRPYFFRSGYMFDSILRKAKRAPLTKEQAARLQHVLQSLAAWRARKNALNGA